MHTEQQWGNLKYLTFLREEFKKKIILLDGTAT